MSVVYWTVTVCDAGDDSVTVNAMSAHGLQELPSTTLGSSIDTLGWTVRLIVAAVEFTVPSFARKVKLSAPL